MLTLPSPGAPKSWEKKPGGEIMGSESGGGIARAAGPGVGSAAGVREGGAREVFTPSLAHVSSV